MQYGCGKTLGQGAAETITTGATTTVPYVAAVRGNEYIISISASVGLPVRWWSPPTTRSQDLAAPKNSGSVDRNNW